MEFAYRKRFDPAPPGAAEATSASAISLGDRGAADAYLFDDHATLAVNIALATGRPILVRGPSGAGKSSLARAVAAELGWSYVEAVVTSRTQARDLLWRVDHLRRLQDAQLGRLGIDEAPYVAPGPLFWAFDPEAAWELMVTTERLSQVPPGLRRGVAGTVALIDEIDKADPDVPNNLLEALGSLTFTVEELNRTVAARTPPLTIVTTNEERDLPPAFLRRCVALTIAPASAARLAEIGRLHLPGLDPVLIEAVARLVVERGAAQGMPPSAAEFLDMLRACRALGIGPDEPSFLQVARMTLWKDNGEAEQ
ncbi:AAA family ATPase [Roseomonas sp. GCM10028921]